MEDRKNRRAAAPDGFNAQHRRRLRGRFLQSGLDGFTDEQALELLLFYALPRIDTKPLARALLTQFGSLAGVLEAGPDALTRVPGVGTNTASLLGMLLPLLRKYELSRAAQHTSPVSRDRLLSELDAALLGVTEERIALVCLDARGRVLSRELLAEGTAHTAELRVREILSAALHRGAAAVAVAHSHPRGELLPSDADRAFDLRLRKLLRGMDVELREDLIWKNGRFTPVREPG